LEDHKLKVLHYLEPHRTPLPVVVVVCSVAHLNSNSNLQEASSVRLLKIPCKYNNLDLAKLPPRQELVVYLAELEADLWEEHLQVELRAALSEED
jgi:hypothetical protein